MKTQDVALLRKLCAELPSLARQAAAEDAAVRTAGALRLQEWCQLTAHLRAGHRTSRRAVLKAGAGATFAFWSLNDD